MTGRRFAQILVAWMALLAGAGGCTNVILALSDYTLCGVGGGTPGCGGGGGSAGDDGGSDGPSTDARTAR
jgi:hypothetical protein